MSLRSLKVPAALHSRTAGSLSLFLLTFLLYWRTLAPGVYGFDSAELATGVFTQGIVHPPGYPLYLLLGKLFMLLPVGDIAYRLNLMSAFFASLTAVILYWVMDNLIENRFASWVSAFLLAVSNYFWQMALIAEVYTPFTAFLATDLLTLSLWHKTGLRKYLLCFAFLYGLTLTIHTSAILFAPAFAWLVLKTPQWKRSYWPWVGMMFVLFLTGLIPYGYLLLRAGAHPILDYTREYPGVDLTTASGLWWLVSGKAYEFFAFGYSWQELPNEVIRFAEYLWRNYLGVGVIFGALGMVWLWRRNSVWTIGLSLIFLANAFFYINYRVMDKDTMFLPSYVIWAVFMGSGFAAMSSFTKWMISRDLFEPWLKEVGKVLPVIFLPLAIGLNWRWVDMSKAEGYSLFAREMMAGTPANSVIIAPWSSAVVLEYYQVVEGQRPDLLIVNRSRLDVARYYVLWNQGLAHEQIMKMIDSEEVDFIDQYIQNKAVYAVVYDPVLANKFEYVPEGPIFRLARP